MNRERQTVRINEPQDSASVDILIRFGCRRGPERDPDSRAEGSIGTDQERIWRSKPNTRAWAWRGSPKTCTWIWSKPNTRAWACWGERGMEKGEKDTRVRDEWNPVYDTVDSGKSLNGTLPGLKWQKCRLQPSQGNSKQSEIGVSNNGISSKLF